MDNVDKEWVTDYAWAVSGTRCTRNTPPVLIKRDQYYTGKRYSTKEKANEYYEERLRQHARHILAQVSGFKGSALEKRLEKYGMHQVINAIHIVNDIYEKI